MKTESSSPVTRVMVFGTFDMVHKGHLDFFRQARFLVKNPYLIVSIARDVNVERIKKIAPQNHEDERLQVVAKVPRVNKVVLGGIDTYLPHIIAEQPDIIALGYDQIAYVQHLQEELNNAGLQTKLVRLKPFKPHLYKTSFLLKKSR